MNERYPGRFKDIFLNDTDWADWSEAILAEYSADRKLYINPIVYSEISIGFTRIEDLESALLKGGFQLIEIPKEALFLAGKVLFNLEKLKESKSLRYPIFISAHMLPCWELT